MEPEKKLEDILGDPASMKIVQLMLAPYDDLVEVDMYHGRTRALRHKEGKYFVPLIDSSVKDIMRYSIENMVHPDDQELYARFIDPRTMPERMEQAEIPGLLRARFRYKLLSGGWRWVEQVNIGGPRQGLPEGLYYGFIFDLEELGGEKAEQKSVPSVKRSELTGLMWEESFFARSKEVIREQPRDWCMIAVDLEHFKIFNEWYGRKQGDLLLAQIGARLNREAEETGGLAGYYGQDDFAMLVPSDEARTQRLFEDLHALITEHGTSVGFMPALGVTPVTEGSSVEELYDRASLASHHAKANYHTRVCVYDPALFRQTEKDYQILSDFQNALEEHELFIVLQPQCAIATGRVVGAESLVRWKKADGTMVPPGVFVPVLEEYGFVTELDKYVWEEVCIWQKRWIDGGHTPLPVSVNVSQIDIFTIDVPAFLEELLHKYSLPVEVVKVEITESAYVDNDSVVDTVQRLRDKGFLVLMDDFGSGYSSLNMLRSLNVDIIKLDAQFLRMNKDDRKGMQIIESIVNMAKTMGMPIIVEGVETQEETDFLSGLGCSYVQGYFFYKPMPVREYEKLIGDPNHIDESGFHFEEKEQFYTREFLDQGVFSDAVLNNILGPVAFLSWHGDRVDVIRYNQQFYEETKLPNFSRRTKAIQRHMPPEDRARLRELMEQAVKNPLGGAGGVLRFTHPNGGFSQYRMHFFFLEEDDSGKKFFVSTQNLTRFITLNDHMRLLSLVSTDTIVFMRRRRGEWIYQPVVHGLEEATGLSRRELASEFSSKWFYRRVDAGERDALRRFAMENAGGEAKMGISEPFHIRTEHGGRVALRLWIFNTHDKNSGVEHILLLRKEEN